MLDSSTINICTVEIQPTCKLQDVLSKFPLPSSLNVLRINNNNLDYEDILALCRCLKNVNGLCELNITGTKFSGAFSLLSVLDSCSDLKKIVLTDNGFVGNEIKSLKSVLECMRNLETLNLSKSNFTATQANDILQKHGKSIASLNLSGNALTGNEITVGICQLQCIEEVNLSNNHISFHPLLIPRRNSTVYRLAPNVFRCPTII